MKNIKIIFLLFYFYLILTPPSFGQGQEYIIGVEDNLFISVWDNTNLSITVTVRPDGKISFPLIDDIQAAGETALSLRNTISKKLTSYITSPDVTVIVTAINSRKLFIFGEVNRPGVYSVSRNTMLLHLFSIAGGLTGNEDLTSAKLIRSNTIVPVDFFALIKKGVISHNISLLPDDTIYIPDNFNNRISVIGEVKNPVNVPFRQGMTLLDAVLSAGGLTEFSKASNTKIYRKKDINKVLRQKEELKKKKLILEQEKKNIKKLGPVDFLRKKGKKRLNIVEPKVQNLTEEVITIDLENIMENGELSENITLNPRDIIIVPKSIF